MDLKQIRYFLNLADTLSFTRAADLSEISQPALTKAVRRLEKELGGRLIHRDGKDTRLTELGRSLRTEFEKIIANEVRALELADQIVNDKRTVLSIGIASTLGPNPVGYFIDLFMEEVENVELIIESVHPSIAGETILSGALDACICADVSDRNSKLHAIPLYEEKLVAAISASHRLTNISTIPVQELANERYIDRVSCDFRVRVIHQFMDNDVLMRPRIRSDREDWVQHAIARGFGISMIPERAIFIPGIEKRPVKELNLSRSVCLLTIYGSTAAPTISQLTAAAEAFDWT